MDRSPETAADGGLVSPTRRELLAGAARAGALVSGAVLLGACGGSPAPSGTGGSASGGSSISSRPHGVTELPGGTPRRGGTFTVGVLSGGQEENLFPGTPAGTPDFVRDYNLYNLLFYLGPDATSLIPGLALSAESDADAKTWTFRLRDGVTWHDGKPFTAADVAYNFRSVWSDPSLNYSSGLLAGLVDLKAVRQDGKLTVHVPLNTPVAQFPTLFAYFDFPVVQQGATAKGTARHPVGTGPFRYQSLTPGRHSVFTANTDYWESGKPYVDRLVVDSSFTDTNTLFSALLEGKINLFPSLPLVTARQQLTAKQVQILESPVAAQSYMFAMRVDKGPFADNRARTAMKLLADRQAMIDGAWAGFGDVAYDLLAPNTRYYAAGLTRDRDLDQARSLLRKAGLAGATITLPTCDFLPGMVESSKILAQQAAEAGLKINVDVRSAATYFTPAGGYLTRPFGCKVDQPAGSLLVAYRSGYTPHAPYPDTRWGSQPGGAAAQRLISKAIGATSPAQAASLWRQCQLQQFHEGGSLVWGNLPYVDAAASNVRGLKAGAGFSYNNWRLQDGWLG
jgi:peptide/nickel transport system substrate-binding protein